MAIVTGGTSGVGLAVSSSHAIETQPVVVPYTAAKAAVSSLARSSVLEGRSKGIPISAVLPGAIPCVVGIIS
ncbi:MAG: SDR family NAD(P)-dependent oxidoreductase [Bacteroidetes bacterium]|nr:SDR family NAD(P)-dependent oxidoreductase [Fibrella sp.]